jgi:hypothetical protein
MIDEMEAVIFLTSVTFIVAVGSAIIKGYSWTPMQRNGRK